MNALELHLLATIADAPDSHPVDFEHCRSTLTLLEARGLIKATESDQQSIFRITERGLSELRRELSCSPPELTQRAD